MKSVLNTKCPLCGATEAMPFYGSDPRIVKCLNCETGYLSPELWMNDFSEYYDGNESYAENAASPEKIHVMQHGAEDLLRYVRKYCRAESKASLLDVGSNYGSLLEAAQQVGYTVTGVELNKQLVEAAQERGLLVVHGDLEAIMSSKQFDIITMIHVLEHVPDIRSTLQQLNSLLLSEGYLFIEVHNADSYLSRKHKTSWKYVALEHLFYFTPRTLSKVLREEGFVVKEVIPRNHYLETFSISYLWQYLWASRQQRDRFFKKGSKTKQTKNTSQKLPWWRKPICWLLIKVIKLLGRQDLMLIIAQKK